MTTPDVHFHFDPVCPFAWLTSQWLRTVADARGLAVEWRLISLLHLNEGSGEPRPGHVTGLRLLRVAARARATAGPEVVGPLYASWGNAFFETPGGSVPLEDDEIRRTAAAALQAAELPAELASALDDDTLDLEIRQETEQVLALTGKDVGTPILHLSPPGGPAIFGPVISRRPEREAAVELWDHVTALAAFPGFAELKRSLRELPKLPAYES